MQNWGGLFSFWLRVLDADVSDGEAAGGERRNSFKIGCRKRRQGEQQPATQARLLEDGGISKAEEQTHRQRDEGGKGR